MGAVAPSNSTGPASLAPGAQFDRVQCLEPRPWTEGVRASASTTLQPRAVDFPVCSPCPAEGVRGGGALHQALCNVGVTPGAPHTAYTQGVSGPQMTCRAQDSPGPPCLHCCCYCSDLWWWSLHVFRGPRGKPSSQNWKQFHPRRQVFWIWFSSVQLFSCVRLFVRLFSVVSPWTAARQASLSITNSQSPPKPTSIESVMPSNHLILCHPLLLLPPIPPSIRIFSNESTVRMRWPKYWHFSFNISPSNEHPGLISFRMDWLDLLAVQGTLKSLLQHHSSKASILLRSAFFIVQLSHPYMTTRKTIALTRWTFVGKVMSLLFNMLSRLVITFLPRSKHLLISWLQSPSAVILEPPKNKVWQCFHCFPFGRGGKGLSRPLTTTPAPQTSWPSFQPSLRGPQLQTAPDCPSSL